MRVHSLFGFFSFAIAIFSTAVSGATDCKYRPIDKSQLKIRDGYLDFIPPDKLRPFKEALPRVSNSEIDAALKSEDSMWYDEDSMVYFYQDSIETVVGGRANCVARETGLNNAGSPIFKLTHYFGEDYRFMFPFRTAAGTDNVTNVRVLNFWKPPRRGNQVMPVKWWKQSSRGRWRWAFPVDTIFGEVLYQKGPDGKWYVFEIRTRKRYLDGWEVDAFRPFPTAASLADAINSRRPDWYVDFNTYQFVQHLRDKRSLTPHKMVSKAYGEIFEPISGALDILPPLEDHTLVAELLSNTPFVSMQGYIWKENGRLETYAPSSSSEFNIVPKGYEMGLIPVNEVSCRRCHSEVGRRLGDLEFDIQLYGEIWGEDEIFTWHLFEPHARIFGTFDDVDNSRTLNPRMVSADLLLNEKPSSSDPDYKPLPSAFNNPLRKTKKGNTNE